MSSNNVNDMTVGSPMRAIFRFAVPLILGYILQQMYLVIDTVIVGRWIGVNALAAIGASLHHVLDHGLLQWFVRRLRHPSGSGFRGEGLPKNANLREQQLSHSHHLRRGHHPLVVPFLQEDSASRQHPIGGIR